MRLVSSDKERRCSRHLTSAVASAPLQRALDEALRPGHRPPEEVKRLAAALESAWYEAQITAQGCDDFFVDQIEVVVELFADAAKRGDAVECEDDESR